MNTRSKSKKNKKDDVFKQVGLPSFDDDDINEINNNNTITEKKQKIDMNSDNFEFIAVGGDNEKKARNEIETEYNEKFTGLLTTVQNMNESDRLKNKDVIEKQMDTLIKEYKEKMAKFKNAQNNNEPSAVTDSWSNRLQSFLTGFTNNSSSTNSNNEPNPYIPFILNPPLDSPDANDNNASNLRPQQLLQEILKPKQPDIFVQLEDFAEQILKRALSRLFTFSGMLSNALGDKTTWTFWKNHGDSNIPLVRGATSISAFVKSNAHLGQYFLKIVVLTIGLILQEKKESSYMNFELVGAGDDEGRFTLESTKSKDDRLEEQTLELIQNIEVLEDLISREAPITRLLDGVITPEIEELWAFSVLPNDLFEDLLSSTTMGAMLRAKGQINRIRKSSRPLELKQLIISSDTCDVFALYTSYQYLMASGGNAYAKGVNVSNGKVKGTNYMLSAGISTRQKLYADIATGQFWWQDVFIRNNPAKQKLEVLISEYTRNALANPLKLKMLKIMKQGMMDDILVHRE